MDKNLMIAAGLSIAALVIAFKKKKLQDSATCATTASPQALSLTNLGIRLVVLDMAGTTVDEGGIVYKTLFNAMVGGGLTVTMEDLEPWHGAQKVEVIRHFVRRHFGTGENEDAKPVEEMTSAINVAFEQGIEEAYFGADSPIKLISPKLPEYLQAVRAAGIKVALNTGYPVKIQKAIIQRLGMESLVDAYISAQEVPRGRPAPYMIHTLMQRLGVESVAHVAKAGDSVRDVEEGQNAGCRLSIGVLSGADDRPTLERANADLVVSDITTVPI